MTHPAVSTVPLRPLSRRRLLTLAAALCLSACTSAPPAPTPASKPKLALALGGGAAKGFAHVGVIKLLESHGIYPDIVTGTSAGAVVGSLYAAGYSGIQLQNMAVALDPASISDLILGESGFVKGEKLERYINQQVSQRPIEKLNRAFGAVVTDLANGNRVVFRRGNTGQAVRASAAVPGVFEPVLIQGRKYVDGGVVSPVPVYAAREMGADIVIAVDISTKPSRKPGSGTLNTLDQTLNIMGQKLSEAELQRATVVIRPDISRIGSTDFAQKNQAILEGEKAAQAALPAIRRALKL